MARLQSEYPGKWYTSPGELQSEGRFLIEFMYEEPGRKPGHWKTFRCKAYSFDEAAAMYDEQTIH